MGSGSASCFVCEARISPADFEHGRAVTILKKHLCSKCSVAAVTEASEGPSHDPTLTPLNFKVGTQRLSRSGKGGLSGRRLWIVLAALVGALGVISAVFLAFSSRS